MLALLTVNYVYYYWLLLSPNIFLRDSCTQRNESEYNGRL